jgi:hypothetical protein
MTERVQHNRGFTRGPGAPKRRGAPRLKGIPKPVPGSAKIDVRTTPDFAALARQFPAITVPEYLVFRWLERKQGWRYGREFVYLDYLPGVDQEGEQQVDFTTITGLAFAVDGVHWHLEPVQRARDLMNKWLVRGVGYTPVTLLDIDLVDRLEATMTAAMQGLEMPTVELYGVQL